MRRQLLHFGKQFSNISSRRLAATALFGGVGYVTAKSAIEHYDFPRLGFQPFLVKCASIFKPQECVISETKSNALYLSIHLNPSASPQDCMKAIGNIQQLVDKICPPDMRDESDEILFGVGFGPTFFDKIKDSKCNVEEFKFRSRYGPLGDMPSTDDDIFIHAKCDEYSKLYELTTALIDCMPKGSVAKFSDTYGWVYRGGRDLTGFIDGTENPADSDDRFEVAVNPQTGGSYLVAQKWVHNHKAIKNTKDGVKEGYIGRSITDSMELKKKSITSHVARMVGSTDFAGPKVHQVVRQSQPWGTVSGDSGLFFVAYAKSPVALDWMLDRMTGYGEDKHADDVMRLTTCISSTYWYFPSKDELARLIKNAGAADSWW